MKLSETGDFTGTIMGGDPTLTEPGLSGAFNAHVLGTGKHVEVYSDADVGDKDTLRLTGGYLSKGRVFQIYNYTGVTDGSLTDLNVSRESGAIHHYNDNNVFQIDNCGRGNSTIILRHAINYDASKHNEPGSGKFLNFLRDCSNEMPVVSYTTDDGIQNITIGMKVLNKFDGNVYQAVIDMPSLQLNAGDYANETKWSFVGGYGNEIIGAVDDLDWYSLGLSGTQNDFGLAITGRWGDSNKARLLKPVLIYTKGISATKQGTSALKLYSLAFGGSCLELNNLGSSSGYLLKMVSTSTQQNSGGIFIDNYATSPAFAIINRGVNQPNINIQKTSSDTYGDVIRYINEIGSELFKIAGDGKSIKMIDTGTGTLKTITINSGVLQVA
jgi:hypothetical protein